MTNVFNFPDSGSNLAALHRDAAQLERHAAAAVLRQRGRLREHDGPRLQEHRAAVGRNADVGRVHRHRPDHGLGQQGNRGEVFKRGAQFEQCMLICWLLQIRSVETGHLDGVFMHKKAQRLKFLCERNDKVFFSSAKGGSSCQIYFMTLNKPGMANW